MVMMYFSVPNVNNIVSVTHHYRSPGMGKMPHYLVCILPSDGPQVHSPHFCGKS